jgi:ASC-1-like (ASCH) protein
MIISLEVLRPAMSNSYKITEMNMLDASLKMQIAPSYDADRIVWRRIIKLEDYYEKRSPELNVRKPTINVQKLWFHEIFDGYKKVEGCVMPEVGSPFYSPGSILVIGDNHMFNIEILKCRYYASLKDFLKAEGWLNCMPSATSWRNALYIYNAIKDGDNMVFDPKIISKRGIVALVFGEPGPMMSKPSE